MATLPTELRRPLPLVVPAPVDGLDPAVWAADRRQWIEDALEDCGGRRPYEGAREIVVAMPDPVTAAAS